MIVVCSSSAPRPLLLFSLQIRSHFYISIERSSLHVVYLSSAFYGDTISPLVGLPMPNHDRLLLNTMGLFHDDDVCQLDILRSYEESYHEDGQEVVVDDLCKDVDDMGTLTLRNFTEICDLV